MSEAVKNLLKGVGVDFKTQKSIELSEEKNEKMRLAEEKRKEQRRRNKEIKSKHSIFESKKSTNKKNQKIAGLKSEDHGLYRRSGFKTFGTCVATRSALHF